MNLVNKVKSAIPVVLLAMTTQASADTFGASAGVMGWQATSSGVLQAGGSGVDLEDDLNFSDDTFLAVYVSLEHPVPALPNVKFQYYSADQVENGRIDTSFNGVDFNGTVNTNLNLSHYDFIMYYEVLDNIVSLDLGVNAKVFTGDLDIRQQNDADKRVTVSISEAVPLLYASGEVAFPFAQSVSFGVDASGMAISGNSVYDVAARMKLRLSFADLQVGYREIQADLEDIEGIDVDIDISGPFVSAGLSF